jgi:NADH:ubiquinone oxidoreductase subunit K
VCLCRRSRRQFFLIKSKAIGLDYVSLKFDKLLVPSVIPHISNFFNFCFAHDIFLTDWKVSKIIPLPKLSNPSDFLDYRPIAILPCLSKAFEVCMRGQMVEYLMLNKLLDPFNPGSWLIIVRRPHCLWLSMISVELLILGSVLILLDFSRTFDSIDHKFLLIKLFLHSRFQ